MSISIEKNETQKAKRGTRKSKRETRNQKKNFFKITKKIRGFGLWTTRCLKKYINLCSMFFCYINIRMYVISIYIFCYVDILVFWCRYIPFLRFDFSVLRFALIFAFHVSRFAFRVLLFAFHNFWWKYTLSICKRKFNIVYCLFFVYSFNFLYRKFPQWKNTFIQYKFIS